MADWRYELGFDTHSISSDPKFVDATDPRGFDEFGGLTFQGVNNGTGDFSGPPVVTAIDRFISFGGTFGGFRAGLPNDNQSYRWIGEIFLAQAQPYTFWINSAGPQRLIINGTTVVNDYDLVNASGVEKSGQYTPAAPGWVSIEYDVIDPAGGGLTTANLEWATPDNATRRIIHAAETPTPNAPTRPTLRYSNATAADGTQDDFHLLSSAGSYHGGLFTADAADSPRRLTPAIHPQHSILSQRQTENASTLAPTATLRRLRTPAPRSSSSLLSPGAKNSARALLLPSSGARSDLLPANASISTSVPTAARALRKSPAMNLTTELSPGIRLRPR